jgi:hypothetical protein
MGVMPIPINSLSILVVKAAHMLVVKFLKGTPFTSIYALN